MRYRWELVRGELYVEGVLNKRVMDGIFIVTKMSLHAIILSL